MEELYEKKAEGARITTQCLWYEEVEKSSKLFLNLKKMQRYSRPDQKTYSKQPRNYASEQDSE